MSWLTHLKGLFVGEEECIREAVEAAEANLKREFDAMKTRLDAIESAVGLTAVGAQAQVAAPLAGAAASASPLPVSS